MQFGWRLGALCSSLLVLAVPLTACEEPVSASREAVVYGVDGRTEVYAHPNATLRAIAESAIAMKVNTSVIDDSDPSNVRLDYTRTLGEARSLCAGQPFADQIEPGSCSGTLIDGRHLLTAGHCMDEARDCTNRAWVFGFRYVSAGTLGRLTSDDVYYCSRVVAYFDDDRVDYAVVELDRPVVGHTPAPVQVEPSGLGLGTSVALIGHPNGIPMKIDDGGVVTWNNSDASYLNATVDAFNANSGSGIFDASGRLVALLRGGMDDYVDAGGCNVVNVIDPPPTDDGEGLTYVRPALEAFCAAPGVDSPLCDCDGPCVPSLDGDQCAEAEAIAAQSQVITGTLTGYAPTMTGGCGGDGPDRSWSFEVTAPTELTARSEGFDSVLYLRNTCDGPDLACHDDVDRDTDRGSLIRTTLVPGSYVLVLDAYDSDVDAFTLTLDFTTPAEPDAGPPEEPDAGAGTESDAGPATPPSDDGGCGVARSAGSPSLGWMLAALALVGWRRRR